MNLHEMATAPKTSAKADRLASVLPPNSKIASALAKSFWDIVLQDNLGADAAAGVGSKPPRLTDQEIIVKKGGKGDDQFTYLVWHAVATFVPIQGVSFTMIVTSVDDPGVYRVDFVLLGQKKAFAKKIRDRVSHEVMTMEDRVTIELSPDELREFKRIKVSQAKVPHLHKEGTRQDDNLVGRLVMDKIPMGKLESVAPRVRTIVQRIGDIIVDEMTKPMNESASDASQIWSMTRAQFLGNPRLYDDKVNVSEKPKKLLQSTLESSLEPFLGKYQIRKGPDQYAVFDGNAVVATYTMGDNLVVAKEHRKNRIGSALLAAWKSERDANPSSASRTHRVHRMYGTIHRESVIRAIRDGHKVPDAVMADYPDLVATESVTTDDASFKGWFKDSVAKKDGKPLVLYHGTNDKFDVFDIERSTGAYGSGIYMTDTLDGDDRYGTIAIPLYASIQNPVDFRDGDVEAVNRKAVELGLKKLTDLRDLPEIHKWSKEMRLKLIDAGYDGAITPGENGATHYIAFHPNQVKHAENNKAFDPQKDSINEERSFFDFMISESAQRTKFVNFENMVDELADDSLGDWKRLYDGQDDSEALRMGFDPDAPDDHRFSSYDEFAVPMRRVIKRLLALPDPVKVYRVLKLKDESEYKPDDGEHWTFDGESLRWLVRDFGATHVVTGLVSLDDVNWAQTAMQNARYSLFPEEGNENEITVDAKDVRDKKIQPVSDIVTEGAVTPDPRVEAVIEDSGLTPRWLEDGDVVERVVWSPTEPQVLSSNKLTTVGIDSGSKDVFAVHGTSDPVFWVWALSSDYGRDPQEAWLIEVIAKEGDALVEDEQYSSPVVQSDSIDSPDPDDFEDDEAYDAAIQEYEDQSEWASLYPDGYKADSGIMLTPRAKLHRGEDFKVIGRFNEKTRAFNKAIAEASGAPRDLTPDELKEFKGFSNIEVPRFREDGSEVELVYMGEEHPHGYISQAERAERAGHPDIAAKWRRLYELWKIVDAKRAHGWFVKNELPKSRDADEMRMAGREFAKESGAKLNANGTIRVYHGTSNKSARSIERTGKFNGFAFFFADPDEDGSIAGNGAKHYAAVRAKQAGEKGVGTVMTIDADPRDLSFNRGSYEIEAQDGLKRGKNGIWVAPKGKLTESSSPKSLAFTNDVRGAHHGQVDATIYANIDGHRVGRLDYSLYQGTAHIDMVEVDPEFRRQGIGTALFRQLKKEHRKIRWSNTTDEGEALRLKVDPPKVPRSPKEDTRKPFTQEQYDRVIEKLLRAREAKDDNARRGLDRLIKKMGDWDRDVENHRLSKIGVITQRVRPPKMSSRPIVESDGSWKDRPWTYEDGERYSSDRDFRLEVNMEWLERHGVEIRDGMAILFHGTNSKNAKAIRSLGKFQRGTHFATSNNWASKYAEQKGSVVFKVAVDPSNVSCAFQCTGLDEEPVREVS